MFASEITLAQDPLAHTVTGDVLMRWTVENGLPINAVTDLVQDEAGFLWLSTRAGLVRFDGLSFKTYDSHSYPGLASDRLTNLYQMPNQDLWVRSEQSDLARFDGTDFRSLTTWPCFEQAQVIGGDQNQQGGLALALRDGLALIDANGPRRILADEVSGISEQILWSSPERIWAVVDQMLLDISLTSEPGAAEAKSSAQIRRQWPLPARTQRLLQTDGSLWIGTTSGLHRLDLPITADRQPVAQPGLPKRSIARLAQHPAGGLLVDTGDTVWWQRLESGAKPMQGPSQGWHTEPLFEALALRQHTEFLVPFQNTTGIHLDAGLIQLDDRQQQFDGAVVATLLDHAGNTWLALHGKGLALHRSSSLRSLGMPEGLPGENVYPIFQASDGAIWIGILGLGAVRIDPEVDASTPFTVYQNESLWVWSIAEFDDGIWLGGEPCKVVDAECIEKPLVTADEHGDGFIPGSVYLLYRDQNGKGWLGTEFGGLYQKHGEQWIQSPLMQNGWPIKTPIRTVEEAPDGALWFGTGGDGIVRISGSAVEQYTAQDGLSSNLVRDLWFDANGELLVATENRGLCRLQRLEDDRPAADIRCLSTTQGLFSNSLHQILPDSSGRLWISTNQGLFWLEQTELGRVFDGDQDHILQTGVLDASDGMRNSELNGGAFPTGLRDRNGRLWWPGQSGLVVLNPDDLDMPSEFQTIRGMVDEIITDSSHYSTRQTSLQLSSGERSVQLVLTAASFNDPANTQFRFSIPGVYPDWVEAGRARLIGPIDIPPGELEIITQARVGAGPWGESSTLQISVPHYWYEYRLLQLALIAMLIGLMVWALRAREQARARRSVELEQTIEERTAELKQAKQETEQALDKVRRSSELRTELFANIGHELRTPLTLISGPLEDAMQARRSVDVATLDGMSRSTRRMQHLVNQILDLRQTDDATFSLNRMTEDVLALLTDCCAPLSTLAARRGLNLMLVSELAEARADVDRDAFEKIIGNLLSNAIKFSSPGGNVSVDLSADLSDISNQCLTITVKDQGPGVFDEDAEHIFERFYRAKLSRQRAVEGTGIGLSLARQLAHLHGGDIVLRNPGVAGAIFVLTLPATRLVCSDHSIAIELPQPEPASSGIAETDCTTTDFSTEQPSAPDAQAADSPLLEIGGLDLSRARPRVLVVEDDANLREYMMHCLNDRYEVLEAGNGQDGLELARTAKPDLIVTDVMMPQMDGFMLVEQLRENANTATIPVLMLTALGPSGEVEGLTRGADDYLSKPFSREQLRARIHARLGDRERILKAFEQWRVSQSEKHAIDGADDSSNADSGRTHPIVEKARKQIIRHLHDADYSVTKLADDLHLSRSQLHRALTEYAGSSPGKLMRQLRLEAAGELLKQGFSILDVAITTGFTSSSVFSRSFKNHFGCPPSQWK